ncbi:MAG: hypothetical protein ACRBB4_07680 [Neptuniibacter sp.]
MACNTHEKFFTRFTHITVAILLTLSTQVGAKTFFMTEDKPADSYYSNDDIRTEEITGKNQKPAKDFGKKHRLVADYLNSPNDPVAADAHWDSENILQVGVIRRSQGDLDYAGHVCRLVVASKLKPQGIKVRIIYLPSLVAFGRLETLVEHQCA